VNDYPLIFDLRERLCVVVGAGSVGCRKARGLLAAGASVRLISTRVPTDSDLTDSTDLQLKAFQPTDLDGAFLAFAATGADQVDREVCLAARQRGIPVNSASAPADGDFRLPALLRRGDLLLAVATGGRSPALAKALRDRLAEEFGQEWAGIVDIAAALRTRKLTGICEKMYPYKVLEKLLEEGLAELAAAGRTAEINNLLTRVLGETVSLETLGLVPLRRSS
jgi:precorrin-2 dehydrogenase/sirohydrochlorin ferrochelatase